MPWLTVSIVLSVVLTVFLNVALRVFPGASRHIARTVTRPWSPSPDGTRTGDKRVWVPWKAMIVGSVVLTIVLNVALWIARD